MPDLAELRRIVEAHFRVYEAREQMHRGHAGARVFYVMYPPGEFDRRFAAVRADMGRLHPELLVFVRREAGEDFLFVADRPAAPPRRLALHLGLFLATLATTVIAGAQAWQGFSGGGQGGDWSDIFRPEALLWGALTFAVPLMLILGIHELGHFVAARRHGMRPTLPFFIPAPPIIFPFGTMGAFISHRDPMPDRKALFDVGVAGPIAGFLVAIPVLVLGVLLTSAAAVPMPDLDRPVIGSGLEATVDLSEPGRTLLRFDQPPAGNMTFSVTSTGESWSYRAIARIQGPDGAIATSELPPHGLANGTTDLRTLAIPANTTWAELEVLWDSGLIRFGDPLLVLIIQPVLGGDGDYLTHPVFLAGWVGLFIAGINLLPIGQLDGGHVARAVLGDQAMWLSRIVLIVLVILSFLGFGPWIYLAILILALGLQHPAPLNDRTRLDRRRMMLAAATLAIFILSFVPVPLQV